MSNTKSAICLRLASFLAPAAIGGCTDADPYSVGTADQRLADQGKDDDIGFCNLEPSLDPFSISLTTKGRDVALTLTNHEDVPVDLALDSETIVASGRTSLQEFHATTVPGDSSRTLVLPLSMFGVTDTQAQAKVIVSAKGNYPGKVSPVVYGELSLGGVGARLAGDDTPIAGAIGERAVAYSSNVATEHRTAAP